MDDTLPPVPEESLALLLGKRLQRLGTHMIESFNHVPAIPAHAMRFHESRVSALAPARRSGMEQNNVINSDIEPMALQEDIANYPASTLDGSRREALSKAMGINLPVVRIHKHHTANYITRMMGADAVSVGREILLRSSTAIEGVKGYALLGHELTHAAQEQMRPKQRPPTAAEERVREVTALTHERLLVNGSGQAGLSANSMANIASSNRSIKSNHINTPLQAHAQSINQTSTTTPAMRAASQDRDIGSQLPTQTHSTGLNTQQMKQIQDSVYRDLMMRVREEFERGS